jgi:hypothetical protein
VSGTSESRNEHFIVFVNVIQATIARDKGGNFLSILNELNANALSNGRVWLLGFDANLFEHNALGHGGTAHGVGLHGGDAILLAILLIAPTLFATVGAQLATRSNAIRFAHPCVQ